MPQHSSELDLACGFSDFFINKIGKIRDGLQSGQSNIEPVYGTDKCTNQLSTFDPATLAEVSKIIKRSPPKSCMLDPLPSHLLKKNLELLVGPITQIVNTSLASGEFPSRFKRAVISPLIKKASLDCNELKYYRPVSNLSFISKVLERVVASRLNTYLSEQSLRDPSQSAYQQHHSVETTLLKVHNDIMLAMDNNDAIMLVLLDLSAAFDTIDHAILLQRVHDEFGIHGTALSWLQSYLQGRSQCVKIQRTLSPATELHFGVPQGSVLGPVLFTLYTAPIGRIVRQHGLEPMFYADDSQLYITFRPAVPGDEVAMVDRITASLSDIRRWMLANMLQLNDNKTECLIICSPRLRSTTQTDSISMGEAHIVPAAGARNLGVLFGNHMDLERHIKMTCQVAYHQLRNISAIRRMLTREAAETIINAFVTSRLDFCNSLLIGLPEV